MSYQTDIKNGGQIEMHTQYNALEGLKGRRNTMSVRTYVPAVYTACHLPVKLTLRVISFISTGARRFDLDSVMYVQYVRIRI
jgi:hypothetical protein